MFKNSLDNFNFIILDLDNTLYSEDDYLFNGYRCISSYLAEKYNLDFGELYKFLTENFLVQRNGLFDRLLNHFNIEIIEMSHILNVLRSCTFNEKIPLYEKSAELLDYVASIQPKICILTNGNVAQQENKIKNIDWGHFTELLDICYTGDKFPKPNPSGILLFVEKYKKEVAKTVLIGDHLVDELAARNAQINFINVDQI